MAVVLLSQIIAQKVFPPPVKKPNAAAPAAGAQADGKEQPAEKEVAQADDGKEGAKVGDQAADARPQAAGPLPQVAVVGQPAQFLTLGSLDPETGYRMLVTVSNTGASVRRAEMSSSR